MAERQIDFGENVTREIVQDGRIIIYTVPEMNRSGIDAWAQACFDTLSWYPKDKKLRSLHHVTTFGAMLSPYANKIIRKVTVASEDWSGYTAIVMQKSMTSQLIEIVMRQLSRITSGFSVRFFTSKEDAIQWLLEQPDH